jgi:putative cell wall-binding protein
MSLPQRHRRAGVAVVAALGVTGLVAAPALAADVEDVEIVGQQFINEDCARNEYIVTGTYTGDTDDGGGFDDVKVNVWDDGILKDSRTFEVPVGSTVQVSSFLTFTGLFGTGAPGVGIVIEDIDAGGSTVSVLFSQDPFFPEDVDGFCEVGVERIGGADRIETAALLAQRFIAADSVVVATSTEFPDALSATPLADQVAGPLLLTRPGALPADTAAEMTRLSPTKVYVVGGTTAVSTDVVDEIEALVPGATVTRIGGDNRYETSAMLASMIVQDSSKEAFLASGENFPDALVLSALAARNNAPLLLTRGASLSGPTAAALATFDYDDLYAAGGTDVLADSTVTAAAAIGGAMSTRYAGDNRYETSAEVLQEFEPEGDVYVATGEQFPYALTAVPVAGRTDAGIALSRPAEVPAVIMTEIERLVQGSSSPQITVVGGETALSADVFAQLEAIFDTTSFTTEAPQTDSNLPAQD